MSEDDKYMAIAREMAEFTEDRTSYKKVGCVIVKDGEVVGRGYRKTVVFHNLPYRDITYHAEHLALMQAKEKAHGATLYSTMEPCGKRLYGDFNAIELPSPCCELIAFYKIARVVFKEADEKHGSTDYLRSKGIKVNKI